MRGFDAGQAQHDVTRLPLTLLRGFYWFDQGLQSYLQARGWPAISQPQSMVLANLVVGVRRSSDIARNMGITRQAVHATIAQMVDLGMVDLIDDPTNGRVKVITPTARGEAMRRDAQAAMALLGEELGGRLGKASFLEAAHLLRADWGPPVAFPAPDVANDA